MKIRQLPDGRYVELHTDGRLEYCAADGGLLQPLTEGDATYVGLGLQMLRREGPAADGGVTAGGVLVDRLLDDGTATIWHPADEGGVALKFADRHGALVNPLNPSTADDPYVLVWIGDERARAYGTVEQSNELKYGARQPTDEQIDHGGANVLPDIAA